MLRDVMPVGDGRADLVRTVRCTEGTVRMRHEWVVRFDYGRVRPWVARQEVGGEQVIVAVGRARQAGAARPATAARPSTVATSTSSTSPPARR